MLVLAYIKDPSFVTNDKSYESGNQSFVRVNGLSIIPDIRSSHAILLACVFRFVY